MRTTAVPPLASVRPSAGSRLQQAPQETSVLQSGAPVVDSFSRTPQGELTAAAIRALGVQKNLRTGARKDLETILEAIAGRPNEVELLQKLRTALTLPYVPWETAQQQRAAVQRSVWEVRRRGVVPEEIRTLEERKAADPSRVWTHHVPSRHVRPGEFIYVDRSKLDDIIIQMKVYVDGSPEMREVLNTFEDPIEKHLAIPGFTVDVCFVDAPGPGVFTVQANLEGWTTARNWVGTYESIAHELLHLCGLNDEYDYTSHYRNSAMPVEHRLHWFKVGVTDHVIPHDAHMGIMSSHRNKPLRRHALYAAGVSSSQSGQSQGDQAVG